MNLFNISRSRWLWLAGGVALIAVTALSLKTTARETPVAAAKPALTVSTVVAEAADWPHFVWASGGIAAWQEAVIGSELGSFLAGFRLVELSAAVGDRVRKGQELARLQDDMVIAEREQTRASLAEAEASAAEAQANANRARQVEASGALSAQQITQYLTAELTARARVDVLKAKLKTDDLRVTKTRIVAPDDGTISARSATLGAVVQSGQELFRMIRRDRLEWRAELPAADLVRVKPGMRVSLTTTGKARLAGKVRIVAPSLDAQTRSGLVYVDIDSERSGASAGMFASGEIEIGHGPVMTLPQSAVLLSDGFSYVFRLDPQNRVVQTKVGVGQRSGERVAITSGLEAGVAVVASGVGFLSDGDLVRVTAPTGK